MGSDYHPLFEGTVASGATQYVGVPIRDGRLGCQISWKDATSSATITLEASSWGSTKAEPDGAASYFWKDTGVSITGPAGSAAGSTLVNIDNLNQKRGRLKIVAAADCSFAIMDGTT